VKRALQELIVLSKGQQRAKASPSGALAFASIAAPATQLALAMERWIGG